MPEISETLKGSFTKFFGTVRQKIFDGNLWYPLLCIKFFDTPNFLRHWRDAHENFRHCETKKFRRKIVIPSIMHKIFRYPKFSETLKGCPRNFSALWDQNFSTEKRDTPFSSIKLFETKNFLKKSRIPLRKFSALWDIKISTENCDMPPLIHKFFRYQKISGKQKGSCSKLFVSVLWDKKSRQNRDAPPSYAWKFSIKNFSETPKCSRMKYFGTLRQKLRRKIVIFPPLSKLFRYPKLLQQ